jgi:large subunit ribosomal protein L17
MRHRRKMLKLARTSAHSHRILANLALSLIEHHRITTTVAKAKALRPFVEKLITKARRGSEHDRRISKARLKVSSEYGRQMVDKLFNVVGPANATRQGGYTRILKLGRRQSDSAPMALIEFVETIAKTTETAPAPEPVAAEATAEKKPAKAKKAAKAKPAEPEPTAEAPAEEPEKKPAKKPRAKKAAEKKEGE